MSRSTATLLANATPLLPCVIVSYLVWALVQKSQNTPPKLKQFLLWLITTIMISSFMDFALTNIYKAIWEPIQEAIVNFLMGEEETLDPDAEGIPDLNKEFDQYIHNLPNEEIQYTSPQYEIKIILPTGYECKSYTLSSGDSSEENFELYYDEMELTVNIILTDSAYQLFESIGEYYAYYKKIHENKPNIYCPLYEKGTPPYCVFSFNFDEGKEIYYELTYNLDGIWCIAKFTYPTDNRAICDSVIKKYVKTSVL